MGGVADFMIRPVVIVVAIAVAVGVVEAVGEQHQIAARDAKRATFSDSCDYYQARAGTARRGGIGDFVVFLTRTCDAAKVSLDTGTPEQRSRAALLLSRIALLRKTVGRMNAERAAARAATTGFATQFPVTPSGEFLIAHRLGLMIAYEAWLDSGVDFSLASYP